MLTHDRVAQEVRQILANSLQLAGDQVSDDLQQETCSEWTSLNHMMLLLGLEERFGVSFSIDEMLSMTSMLQILSTLERYGVTA